MDQVKSTQNPPVSEDEIDLFELWEGLVQEKLTILYSFLAVVFAAVIYVFTSTPVYQAKTYLLPPDASLVTPMNVLAEALNLRDMQDSDRVANTIESVFNNFQTTLVSRKILKEVFNQYQLERIYAPNTQDLEGVERLKSQQKAFDQFMKAFSVADVDKKEANVGVVAQLSLALSDAEVAEILNTLVLKATQSTIREIASNIVSEREARARLIEQKISGARQIEKDRRLDRIAQLDEAIKITKQVNLTKPIASGPTLNINNMNETGQGDSVALYLLGSDLLEAEKYVLEQRENDDAFIKNLRSWQEELQLLKSLKIEPSQFGVVQVDQQAVFAEKIKPKKLLVLAVAGVLGLMLGVFIALIRRAINKRKESVVVV
jgi:chain length determinant protein (polysaccharide antigen chain regulator)